MSPQIARGRMKLNLRVRREVAGLMRKVNTAAVTILVVGLQRGRNKNSPKLLPNMARIAKMTMKVSSSCVMLLVITATRTTVVINTVAMMTKNRTNKKMKKKQRRKKKRWTRRHGACCSCGRGRWN